MKLRHFAALPTLALALTLTLVLWAPAHADALAGRLFHTAEERAQLDRQRKLGLDPARGGGAALRFDGLIRRGDGKTTVWVNGQRLDADGRRLLTGDGRLVVRSGGGDATLRVGESLDRIPAAPQAHGTTPQR